MAGAISSFFQNLNFYDILTILVNSNYYSLIFPFLLSFAVFYTVLSKVKLFQHKASGTPVSSIIMVISIVISFYGITFETSNGHTIGTLMMMLFPNISALTIGILTLYIVGAILGKDIFHGLFNPKPTSIMFLTIAGIGFGAIIFYVGIAMGFWNYTVLSQTSYWSFIIAILFLIMGIVFLVIGIWAIGVLFLVIFFTFVFNSAQGSILTYFIDPIVFIFVLVIFLLSWLNSDKELKQQLAKDLKDQEISREEYKKAYGGNYPKPYESRIFDMMNTNYENNKKTWNEKFPEDKDGWEKP